MLPLQQATDTVAYAKAPGDTSAYGVIGGLSGNGYVVNV